MKSNHSPRGCRWILTTLTTVFTILTATGQNSSIPQGTLSVDREMIRVGTNSQLTWRITYPNRLVDTDLKPKQNVRVRVRVLGVAFQSGNTLLPFEAQWAKNNTAWTRFFMGTGPSVVPTNILVNTTLNAGETMRFRVRGASNPSGNSWFPFHETNTNDPYIVVLKNGDTPPDYAPAYDQGTIRSFMTSYLDASGKIKIGPQDLIILAEGSTARPGTTFFDMQDIVILLTFE